LFITEKDNRLFVKYFYGEKLKYVMPAMWKGIFYCIIYAVCVGPSLFPQLEFPFFGLDHVNRNPKCSHSIFEKVHN